MVINLAEGHGKWQNADCRDMKEHLMTLDKRGNGRIPLDTFYKTDAGSAYEFTESREYLREVGALDESLKGNPSVLIANYLAGPSNCIASNSYYSVCCLSECEHLMNDIEEHTKGPTASPSICSRCFPTCHPRQWMLHAPSLQIWSTGLDKLQAKIRKVLSQFTAECLDNGFTMHSLMNAQCLSQHRQL